MAYRTLQEANDSAREAARQSILEIFKEISSDNRKLSIEKVEIDDNLDPQDYESQKEAKLKGKPWGPSVYGVFKLEDNKGNVLDRGKIKLLSLPQKTARNTYLFNGQEYQFDTQFRLKPGIYTRITDNGEYASRISAEGKFYRNTEIYFDPETKKYVLSIGTMNVPISVLLDLMGVSKSELDAAVGQEVANVNLEKPRPSEYSKVYRALFGEDPSSPEDYKKVVSALHDSKLDPDATEHTTGKRLTRVDKEALLTTMKKLLHLVQGRVEEDDPDSLVTKSVHYYDDYVKEFILKQAPDIKKKIINRMRGAKKVSDLVPSSILHPAMSKLMMSPLAQRREQHNIIDIVSGSGRTTLRGPGGISDPNMVRDDMRTLHSSHMGFLDPVKTPESSSIGTTLQMALLATKRGNNIVSTFFDFKTGKIVELTPKEVFNEVVAFPDEYDFKDKVPKAKSDIVTASFRGEVGEYPAKQVRYVLASAHGLFHTTTNLIPFIRSNTGIRAMTASRQLEQAIPLVAREAPLVQVKFGASGRTSADVIGKEYGTSISHVDGVVSDILKGKIIIKDKNGVSHTVHMYDNFPLNNSKGYIHSTPTVTVGDKVKKGQVVAYTNYTTPDGKLALGTNLKVAYVAYKGLTFEDAVCISESAAKKLTSDHLHQFVVELDDKSAPGTKKFQAYFPNEINATQASKLDPDGVIKKGQKVETGDFIYAGLVEKVIDPDSEAVLRVSKKSVSNYGDASIRWEKKYPGVVVGVEKFPKKFVVFVKTQEPAVVGDKLVGSSGNKGIISKVIPDDEMPVDSEGKPFDILMNPATIVGRINLGQVYETLAAKVAKKIGKPVVIDNFDSSTDTHEMISGLLKKHGLKDSEIIVDPIEGPTEKPVLTGYQYIFKLTHQVDKKLSARGAISETTGERLPYTRDLTPAGGGKTAGLSIGQLDVYALLASGATSNLQEMFTYKSDAQNAMFWERLKTGGILPDPEVPYTAKKFLAYLNGMGINVKKDGDKLQILPMTDKDIMRLAPEKLTNPGDALDYKLRPIKGGIFDSIKTGGLHGSKFTHMDLGEPVINPIAMDGVTRLLAQAYPKYGAGLVDKILEGKLGLNAEGQIVPIKDAKVVSGAAIQQLLKKIDVDAMMADVEKELRDAPADKVNVYNKTLKYLRALKEFGYRPDEAYILTKFPVIPPSFRPILIDSSGKITMDDVNGLYKKLGETLISINKSPAQLPPEMKAERSKSVQDLVNAVAISGYTQHNRPLKGIMQIISGSAPKYGFYQRKVLRRRQDLSARSTAVPNPELDMDSLEIPEKALWELYGPFVVRNLVNSGHSSVDALTHVKDKTETARAALLDEIKERPVLMKRDPVLHKFGIQAFYPKISSGDTIGVPPSITSGYNLDFDGDAISVFVPTTNAAKEEAKLLVPSKNLFGTRGGELLHKPEQESQLGLYMLTEPGKDTNLSFSTVEQALDAYKQRRLHLQDLFMFKGKKTSLGRLLIANSIPKGRIQEEWYNKIAYDKNFRLDKKQVNDLLSAFSRVQPTDFPMFLSSIRNLGDKAAFKLGASFSLADMKPLKSLNKNLPNEVNTEKKLNQYSSVRDKVENAAKEFLRKSGNNLMRIVDSGARGSWDQMKQIILSPGLLSNSKGQTVTRPVNTSFSEGLKLADYWTTLHGARKGMISKTRGTSVPGYLSRQIITSVADVKITMEDCKTDQGIYEQTSSKDIIGRYLAKPQKIGNRSYPENTLVDSNLLRDARTAGVQSLFVRTPLKCESHDGICSKCYGKWHDGNLPPVGTNIGIISGQSLGERGTQLTLKSFHEAGIKGKTSKAVDQLSVAKNLFEVPKKLRDEAILSQASGSVTSIKQGSTGWNVVVGGKDHFVPKNRNLVVRLGQKVNRGDALSDGVVNVHSLIEIAGTGAAQNHLVSQMNEIYGPLGVNKRHMETVVRYMTDLGVVEDAPQGIGFARGDLVSMAKIDAFNKKNVPVDWAIGYKLDQKYGRFGAGTEVTEPVAQELKDQGILRVKVSETGLIKANPVVKGVGSLPLVRTDDWAQKISFEKIKQTIQESALRGSTTVLSGKWPVPAVGFGRIAWPKSKI